jgi:malonate-semialdehyde dehydrogenase (acetylating)/methylmalonate-semialdehyde dehydrogenase
MAAVLQPDAIPTVKLLINGEWRDSNSSDWRDIVNPATQEVLARVPMCGTDEVDAAIASAAEAFKTWKNAPIGQRARIMLKLQELIRRDMKKLAACLTAEQGKTLPDAEGDVFRGLEVVEHAASIGTLSLGEMAENVATGHHGPKLVGQVVDQGPVRPHVVVAARRAPPAQGVPLRLGDPHRRKDARQRAPLRVARPTS